MIRFSLPPFPIHALLPYAFWPATGTVFGPVCAGVAKTSAKGLPSWSKSSEAFVEAGAACCSVCFGTSNKSTILFWLVVGDDRNGLVKAVAVVGDDTFDWKRQIGGKEKPKCLALHCTSSTLRGGIKIANLVLIHRCFFFGKCLSLQALINHTVGGTVELARFGDCSEGGTSGRQCINATFNIFLIAAGERC